MSIQIKDFGKTTAGQPVKVGILANDTIEVHILSYGATIQQLLVPDRKGNKVDVVLGYPTVQDYELNTCFLGAVVGRYANRIGGSKFTLYEEEYHVTPNEGKNCLHSGLHGFDKTVFDMGFEGDDTLVLTAASPDGTDGFPGNAELEVRYSLAGAGLMIQYTLTTDAPTVANITNHSYFNLNGHASGSVLGHRLSLDAPATNCLSPFLNSYSALGLPSQNRCRPSPKHSKLRTALGLTTSAASTPCAPEAWRSSRVTQSG